MRKTLNINLGGLAFIIDENAFELLHTYLEALKLKFSNEAERTEIMNDIEVRIAEMLNQRLGSRKEVIGVEDVQFVTAAMGKPEDIAGEEEPAGTVHEATAASSSASSEPDGEAVKKRLFRDPDDAKVGGIISGLCHYFGISDPVWMRVGAVFLIFFSSGSIILLYLLLLIVVPKATTAAEKLQMKGEPVNINTIEKQIKDATARAGESMHQFVKSGNVFEKIWDILLSVLKAVSKILSAFWIVIAMFLLVAVCLAFVSFYVLGTAPLSGVSHMLVDTSSTLTLFSFGFLLFFAAPLIALVYMGLKVLLGQRSRVRWLKAVLTIAWLIGLGFLLVTGFDTLNNFKEKVRNHQINPLMQPGHGTLFVQLTDSTGKKISKYENEDGAFDNFIVINRGVSINGVDIRDMDMIPIGRPSLELEPSENDSFYLEEVITSHGRNRADATRNAGMIIYSFNQSDSLVDLRPNFYLNKSGKWRWQDLTLVLAIPPGKKVRFADNIDLWHATVKGDNYYDDTYFNNTVWTVENGKVKCLEGENHKNGDEDSKTDEEKVQPAPPAPPAAPRPPKVRKHSSGKQDDEDF